MPKLNRTTLIKFHLLLASFIFPITLMFAVTGALYTWGIKGTYESTHHEIHLTTPLTGELSQLVQLAEEESKKRNLNTPTGHAKIKKLGDAYKLEWTGSNHDLIIEPTSNPLVANLQIKDTSWYRNLVQLHKAKGGVPFKIYAAFFSFVLLLVFFSGFLMAWKVEKLRKHALISSLLGLTVFVMMVFVS